MKVYLVFTKNYSYLCTYNDDELQLDVIILNFIMMKSFIVYISF